MGLWSRILLFFKIRTSSALDQAEDPRQVMDYAYGEQQELLRKMRQGLVDVATSKRQLEMQAQKLHAKAPQLEEQARRALTAGREDLALLALQRKQAVAAELEGLAGQLAEVAAEEQKLIVAEQQLSSRIEEFRTRRQVASARYTAAEAQVRITEAVTGVSKDFAELSMALGRAEEKTERMLARASSLDALIEGGHLAVAGPAGDVVERELRQLSAERELALLKASIVYEQLPPPSSAEPGAPASGQT
jgi:phage shock protein A